MENTFSIILAQASTAEAPVSTTTVAAPATDANPAQEQPQEGSNFIWIALLFMVGMYFLMIAPQKKKQKQHEEMLKNLESGTDVVTIGGIYGTITNVKEKTFIIKIADNTKIEVLKSAVNGKVVSKDDEQKAIEAK